MVSLCVCVLYQVFLFSSYSVLLFHLIWQFVDLPLQLSDGVGQNRFVPAHITKHQMSTYIRYVNSICCTSSFSEKFVVYDWPLLSPDSVLQLFDSALCPGDDVLLNPGRLKLLYLQTHLTQLQRWRKRNICHWEAEKNSRGPKQRGKHFTCLSKRAFSLSSCSFKSFSWITFSCSCSVWQEKWKLDITN